MTLQLLGKIQKKSNFIFIFGQMIEDQVLFHLPKFGKNIFSLRGFPHPLKGHEKTVREGPRFGTLKYVSTPIMHNSTNWWGRSKVFVLILVA